MAIINKDHIFHITTRAAWTAAEREKLYVHPTQKTEGFIHCSRLSQVCKTAKRFFAGQKNLLLLEVDPTRLRATVKYEGDVEPFPHIYGPIDLESIIEIHEFAAESNGEFFLPPSLTEGTQHL